ncbi:hypothetical protein JOB18_040745 [Solea senegalensis]|uniref:Uncharacterized protein n=1 Tax=Solea senegalensis TaxID=28829 RepID=A0AAV6SHI5_SOLSE|nr:hypothetical protein JOB18_040745 [Solea senegalensis]
MQDDVTRDKSVHFLTGVHSESLNNCYFYSEAFTFQPGIRFYLQSVVSYRDDGFSRSEEDKCTRRRNEWCVWLKHR